MSPGTIQPSATSSADDCFSQVTRPSTTYRSRASPSGSTGPRNRNALMREDATADVVSKMFEEPRRALDRGAGVLDAAGQQPVGRDHCGDVTGAGSPPGLRDDRVVSMPSRVHDPHVGVLPRWHGALG